MSLLSWPYLFFPSFSCLFPPISVADLVVVARDELANLAERVSGTGKMLSCTTRLGRTSHNLGRGSVTSLKLNASDATEPPRILLVYVLIIIAFSGIGPLLHPPTQKPPLHPPLQPPALPLPPL